MSKQIKADGRRVTKSPGVFPYQLTNAQRERIIDSFLATGSSCHSARASTLGVIIEHCQKYDIKFMIMAVPNKSYYIGRLQ